MYEVPPNSPQPKPARRSVGTDLWLLITTGLGAWIGGALFWEGLPTITRPTIGLADLGTAFLVFIGPGALMLTFTGLRAWMYMMDAHRGTQHHLRGGVQTRFWIFLLGMIMMLGLFGMLPFNVLPFNVLP